MISLENILKEILPIYSSVIPWTSRMKLLMNSWMSLTQMI